MRIQEPFLATLNGIKKSFKGMQITKVHNYFLERIMMERCYARKTLLSHNKIPIIFMVKKQEMKR